ncbi:MAG: hypothetical protein K9K88_16730 [Desulfobacterales bacterium]|nr:hypothetical protein [Desulfobacterales bacterium]
MERTIITISAQDKRWLASYGGVHGVSMAEAVRRGIACLKVTEGPDAYRRLVQETAGIWKQGDGLHYQKKIRSEWGR